MPKTAGCGGDAGDAVIPLENKNIFLCQTACLTLALSEWMSISMDDFDVRIRIRIRIFLPSLSLSLHWL